VMWFKVAIIIMVVAVVVQEDLIIPSSMTVTL